MAFLHKKLWKDSAPGFLQVVINQCCGLVIFLVLSVQLDKTAFGEINWALAVLLTSFAILSFGIDQLVVKKIAAGNDAALVVPLFVLHTWLMGLVFYLLLLTGSWLFPHFFNTHYFLLWLALGKLAIFFASPFKQWANGRERFGVMAVMMVISNVLRAFAMMVLFWLKQLNANTVIIVFIAGDVVEWLLCWLLARQHLKLRLSFAGYWQPYKNLLKESLPQLGTAIVSSAMARIDWILMGLMGMVIQLAEYSFAYKMYELATLPLLIIGPLLIPRFARMYSRGEVNTARFVTLLRLEMVIAAATILILCILWVPVTEALALGRYGAVNNSTILLLSASIPFLYLNNLLWTILFVKGKLRLIFYITLVIFLCNLAANLLLIPLYSGKGAAMAYLGAMILQSMLLLYAVKMKQLLLHTLWLPVCVLCAALAGWGTVYFFSNVVVALPVAMLLYLLLLLLSGAFRLKDVKFLPWTVKK